MTLISDSYLRINSLLHRKHPTYGMGGHRWANKLLAVVKRYRCRDALDYGCGKGTLRLALKDTLEVSEYDPAVPGKDSLPSPADLVVLIDVLEHIEPDCLEEVLDHVRGLARTVVFGTIATRPAKKMLPDGRNAHLIIRPTEWWSAQLEPRFKIAEIAEDVTKSGELYFVGVPLP